MTAGTIFFDPSRQRSLGRAVLHRRWYAPFRRAVWSRLQRPVRQAALRLLLGRRRAPLAEDRPAEQPVCVIGLLSTATGIGEGGRLAGRGLAELGYDVRSVDVSAILEATAPERSPPRRLETGAGTALLHFSPDNLPAILTLLGRERLRGKRIIGHWAWELAQVPDAWRPALAEVDEIWTPTRFVAEAFRPLTAKPVRVVPYPVALEAPGTRRREHFRMDVDFVVLAMFSFASFTRKNPVAAVDAFKTAFGDARDRLLIVKSVGRATPEERRELEAAIGGAPNIRLDERELGARERLDLIASADVLLSPHRSEGFGLVLAEAMLAGVPVIATGWSGNLDFMDGSTARLLPYRLVPAMDSRGVYRGDGLWADPDMDAAARHLAELANDPGRLEPMRRAALARVHDTLGLEAFGRAVAQALPPPGCRS